MTAVDVVNNQEIDALLAQADSVMDQVSSDLGTETTVPAEGAEASPASGEAIAFEAAGDAPAGCDASLADEGPDPAGPAPADRLDEETGGAPAAGLDHVPRSAPAEWVQEIGTHSETLPDVPSIPETSVPGAADPAAAGTVTAAAGRPGGLKRLAANILHLPVLALIIIDLPFSWMGPTLKSLIGVVAIATTIVAVATWFGGSLLVK